MQEKPTIVICAYNEEETIGRVIDSVKPYGDVLVVLAKQCRDNTEDVVNKHGAEIIVDNGKGKGDAIRVALKYLNGKKDIAVFIDADESHDASDIPKLIQPIIEDNADLVLGSRMKGGSDELGGDIGEFMRLTFSNIITLIINYRFGVRMTDYQNGFRAMKVKPMAELGLTSNITTIEQEEGIKALRKGLKVVEVPAHEYRRTGGVSKINVWKFGAKYFLEVMQDCFFDKHTLWKLFKSVGLGLFWMALTLFITKFVSEYYNSWYWPVYALTYCTVMFIAFFLDIKLIFKKKGDLSKYAVTYIMFYLFNIALVYGATEWLSVPYYLAIFLVTGFLFVTKFFIYDTFIFVGDKT